MKPSAGFHGIVVAMHDDLDLDDFTSATLAAQARHAVLSFIAELVKASGNPFAAVKAVESRLPVGSRHLLVLQRAVQRSITKSAIPADDFGQGGVPLGGQLANALITATLPYSVVPRAGFTPAPFDRPIPLATALLGAGMVERGQAVPLTRGTFDATSVIRRRSCVALTVVSAELGRDPQALPLLNALLAKGNAVALDTAFRTEVLEAGTPVSAGSDPAADLRAVLEAYVGSGGAMETAVVILSSQNAVAMRLRDPDAFRELGRSGGSVAGLPAFASDSIGDVVAVADTSKILVADSGQVAIDVSTQTSLEMSDSPTMASLGGSPWAPTPVEVVSLFQSNAVAVRCERVINWLALTGAVAFTHADYLS